MPEALLYLTESLRGCEISRAPFFEGRESVNMLISIGYSSKQTPSGFKETALSVFSCCFDVAGPIKFCSSILFFNSEILRVKIRSIVFTCGIGLVCV